MHKKAQKCTKYIINDIKIQMGPFGFSAPDRGFQSEALTVIIAVWSNHCQPRFQTI